MSQTLGKCENPKGSTTADVRQIVDAPARTVFAHPKSGEQVRPFVLRLRTSVPPGFVVFLALQLAFFCCLAWKWTSRSAVQKAFASNAVAGTKADPIIVVPAGGGATTSIDESHKRHGAVDVQPKKAVGEKDADLETSPEPPSPDIIVIGAHDSASTSGGLADNTHSAGISHAPAGQVLAEEIRPPAVSELLANAPARSTQALAWAVDTRAQMPAAPPPRISSGRTGGEIIRRVTPVYPAQARAQGIQGTVVLDITIGEDGTVSQVTVLRGAPLLASAAKGAVQQWRYAPFELNGKPVPIRSQVTLHFTLP